MVVLVGTLAGTVIAGGSLAAGARIVNGTLWLAGPNGIVIALLAEGIAQLASEALHPRQHPDRDRLDDLTGRRPAVSASASPVAWIH